MSLFVKICHSLSYINPSWHIKLRYLKCRKRFFPDRNPKKFQDKLIWLRLHCYNNSRFATECSDKVAVRGYVEKKGWGHCLNEVYGVYESVDDVPWDNLPNQFAMKWNVGSGYNIICKDVTQLDLQKTKETMRCWGEEEYWVGHAEMQYKHCKKLIMIEKYLGNDKGVVPSDYKLYCFNGKCRAILYMDGRTQSGTEKELFFSAEWHYLGQIGHGTEVPSDLPDAPKSLQEMIACAESLSENVPFLRVDFYEFENRAYFGEMTFSPASGFWAYSVPLNNRDMGEYIDLSKKEVDKFKELEASFR